MAAGVHLPLSLSPSLCACIEIGPEHMADRGPKEHGADPESKEHKADRVSMLVSVKLIGHALRNVAPEHKVDREWSNR